MGAADKLPGRDSSGSVLHQASPGMPGPGSPCARDSLETCPLFTGGQLHGEEGPNVISELQRRASGSPYRSARGLCSLSSEPSSWLLRTSFPILFSQFRHRAQQAPTGLQSNQVGSSFLCHHQLTCLNQTTPRMPDVCITRTYC